MIEVGRNERAQPAEGFDPAAAILQRSVRGVDGDAGSLCGRRDAGSGGIAPRLHSRNQEVRAVLHAPEVVAENCDCQRRSQKSALPDRRSGGYRVGMPYDPEHMQAVIRRHVRQRGLKYKPLAEKAGVGERTVSAFLKGDTRSMRVETLCRVAEAAEIPLAELLNLDVPQPSIDASAFAAMVQILEQSARRTREVDDALEAARKLARSLAP